MAIISFYRILKKSVISIVSWMVVAFLTAFLFFVMLFLAVPLSPFDRNRTVLHRQCFWWSDVLTRCNPFCDFQVVGMDYIDPRQTYVIVANHQSLADIAVLYQTRMQFKWVAKKSLFMVPFLGWCLSLARHIKIERGHRGSIMKVYREAGTWLRKGVSVLFFSEGTRSKTGKMLPFRDGAFKLALQEEVAILPIAIKGTAAVIPKGRWILNPGVKVRMSILPALETADLKSADLMELKKMAHEMIEAALR